MNDLPSYSEALKILRKSGCSEKIVKHSILVSDTAKEIASYINHGIHIDLQLVEVGALLHDIGRSTTHGIQHGSVGAGILENLNYPSRLVNVVRNHVGAGIPKEEAETLGLPSKDHLPETIEEKVVCYADKLVSGNKRVSFEQALESLLQSLGSGHPGIERFRNLHKQIVELTGGANGRTSLITKDPQRKK